MDNNITTLEITKNERKKLSFDKCHYNYTYVRAACISVAIGFLLKLIGLIAKPQNTNIRTFFEAAILPSTVIGLVFFIIATIKLILCWIPKANEKIILNFDSQNQIIEISEGRKTKKLKISYIKVISSNNLIIFYSFAKQIMLPLSCFDSNNLITFLKK